MQTFAKWNIRRWAPGYARDRETRTEREREREQNITKTQDKEAETRKGRRNIINEGKKERRKRKDGRRERTKY